MITIMIIIIIEIIFEKTSTGIECPSFSHVKGPVESENVLKLNAKELRLKICNMFLLAGGAAFTRGWCCLLSSLLFGGAVLSTLLLLGVACVLPLPCGWCCFLLRVPGWVRPFSLKNLNYIV